MQVAYKWHLRPIVDARLGGALAGLGADESLALTVSAGSSHARSVVSRVTVYSVDHPIDSMRDVWSMRMIV